MKTPVCCINGIRVQAESPKARAALPAPTIEAALEPLESVSEAAAATETPVDTASLELDLKLQRWRLMSSAGVLFLGEPLILPAPETTSEISSREPPVGFSR